jgi:hypothetical protein
MGLQRLPGTTAGEPMRGLILGLLVLCAACTPTQDAPEAPGAVVAQRDLVVSQAGFTAPGDTLKYAVTWTAGARATGYLVTTTASGTGWSGMLTAAPTASLSMAFTPVNTTAWDSVSFSACVASTRNGKTSAPKCTTWPLVRAPGAPGTVTVDSSLVVASLIVFPHAAQTLVDVPVRICPYFVAADSMVRLVDGYNGSFCRQIYDDSIPPAQRLTGYPIQYDVATTTRAWGGLRLVTRTPRDQLARDMFAGPFT